MRNFACFLLLTTAIFGQENLEQKEISASPATPDAAKISEAFGHLIGKNLESMGFKFDIAQLIKGLQDAAAGRDAPMTEVECVQAITAIQEQAFKQQSADNLKKAEDFLAENEKKSAVKTIEQGKLQYQIETEGKGAAVQPHDSPLIRYKGSFLDGTIFGASKEDEILSLDETIPGFTKGLVGMKEGEKRTLFIHPELGYGTQGYLPPNSLLKFEVEVIQANAPHSEEPSISTPNTKLKGNPEIASPADDVHALR